MPLKLKDLTAFFVFYLLNKCLALLNTIAIYALWVGRCLITHYCLKGSM